MTRRADARHSVLAPLALQTQSSCYASSPTGSDAANVADADLVVDATHGSDAEPSDRPREPSLVVTWVSHAPTGEPHDDCAEWDEPTPGSLFVAPGDGLGHYAGLVQIDASGERVFEREYGASTNGIVGIHIAPRGRVYLSHDGAIVATCRGIPASGGGTGWARP